MTIGEADKRPLTGHEVHDEGLDGWRLVFDRLVVRFDTGGFSAGAGPELVYVIRSG